MNKVVIDGSALIAALFREEGADRIAATGRELLISAVSYSDVLTRALELDAPLDEVLSAIGELAIDVVAVDVVQAITSARLRRLTSNPPLPAELWSCIALALVTQCPLMTATRALRDLDLGVMTEVIR